MRTQPYLKEIILSVVTLIWILFVATNVDQTLGIIYHEFLVIGLLLLIIATFVFKDKSVITFQAQPGGTLKALLIGFIGWIALIFTSVLALQIIDPAHATLASVLTLMGATTPALANSKWANWFTFSLAVPYAETQLWARMTEFFADVFHINITSRRIGGGLLVLLLVMSIGFAIFHLTAKGVTNAPALAIVAIMMLISLIIIIWQQETRAAVYMHMVANGIASYISLFSTGSLQV